MLGTTSEQGHTMPRPSTSARTGVPCSKPWIQLQPRSTGAWPPSTYDRARPPVRFLPCEGKERYGSVASRSGQSGRLLRRARGQTDEPRRRGQRSPWRQAGGRRRGQRNRRQEWQCRRLSCSGVAGGDGRLRSLSEGGAGRGRPSAVESIAAKGAAAGGRRSLNTKGRAARRPPPPSPARGASYLASPPQPPPSQQTSPVPFKPICPDDRLARQVQAQVDRQGARDRPARARDWSVRPPPLFRWMGRPNGSHARAPATIRPPSFPFDAPG